MRGFAAAGPAHDDLLRARRRAQAEVQPRVVGREVAARELLVADQAPSAGEDRHARPGSESNQFYKGVLDGRSHGVFNGKVYVHPEAQKTDGKQTNNTLLLSERAKIDTKPQLEIFADDVKCTHGATVGRIDELALYYMKSRGIGHDTARKLLTYAFAAEVLETIELEPLRDGLERLTLERYAGAEATA